jgi:hypothetical protein
MDVMAATFLSGVHNADEVQRADMYAVWSRLIPVIQNQPGKGYMIAEDAAVPDGIPALDRTEEKSLLKLSMNWTSRLREGFYETIAPADYWPAISEAQSMRRLIGNKP